MVYSKVAASSNSPGEAEEDHKKILKDYSAGSNLTSNGCVYNISS